MTIYNSRGNQIDIAQIAIYNCFLQIKSNQIKCWFLVRAENRSTRVKTSHSRVENQQTQSTFDAECGNRTTKPTLPPSTNGSNGEFLMTSVFRVVMLVVFLVVTVLLASANSGLVIMALVLMMIVPAAHIAMMVLVMVMWL